MVPPTHWALLHTRAGQSSKTCIRARHASGAFHCTWNKIRTLSRTSRLCCSPFPSLPSPHATLCLALHALAHQSFLSCPKHSTPLPASGTFLRQPFACFSFRPYLNVACAARSSPTAQRGSYAPPGPIIIQQGLSTSFL